MLMIIMYCYIKMMHALSIHILRASNNVQAFYRMWINFFSEADIYVGCSSVIDETSFTEIGIIWELTNPWVNLGRIGACRGTEGLWSMRITDDIGGLSAGTSWTHDSAIWMHFNTSSSEQFSIKVGSIISNIAPLLQYSHICDKRSHVNHLGEWNGSS